MHELAQALLGHELGVQQITHPRGDAWSVLDRGGDAVREGGHGHGRAGAAEAAVGTVFGDLEGVRLGDVEELPADGSTVAVGVRQRLAAVRTGRGVVIHDMVRGVGLLQGRSLVARLAATRPARRGTLAPGTLRGLFLFQAVAGRRLAAGGAVERRTPLEFGDAFAQPRILPLERGILPLERGILPDERLGQAQHLAAPYADSLDERHRRGPGVNKLLQAFEGLGMGGEILLMARHRHGSPASAAMMAPSTARRSARGIAA